MTTISEHQEQGAHLIKQKRSNINFLLLSKQKELNEIQFALVAVETLLKTQRYNYYTYDTPEDRLRETELMYRSLKFQLQEMEKSLQDTLDNINEDLN